MFVILPDGFQVMGAGIATMLSNVASLVYFLTTYRRVRVESVLEIPPQDRADSPGVEAAHLHDRRPGGAERIPD